jgi:tRNA(Ile)-lysidine synthase
MSLLDRVRRTIRIHDLARPETRVVVALSGGSDSVALAHIVRELDAAGALKAAGAAHFNHQLRASADRDERLCADIARAFGWRFVADRADVAAIARREKRSVEDAARTARHAFLERARLELGADVVALGHTRDDQAETFLLRLLRGAGSRGLAAMHPRNGAVVRPLLDCRRAELRAYLAARSAEYVDDESNADVGIPRNRVRAELIPLLQDRFNPSIVDVLADQAELARGEWSWMEDAANQIAARASSRSPAPGELVEPVEKAELDRAALLAAPLALRRLVLWRAMTAAAGGRPVAFDHVQDALELLESETAGAGIDAPGHRLDLGGSRIVLSSSPAGAVGRSTAAKAGANFFRYPLSIPGEVRLAEAGCLVSAESGPAGLEPPAGRNPAVAIVRSDVCRGPLAVRNRRPGDRFHPVGLGGRQKKLQDFFVDKKVARATRDAVPLVVDESDRIVWVAGYGIDAEFRVTDSTQAVLILRLKQV